jgi:hypothetical protein
MDRELQPSKDAFHEMLPREVREDDDRREETGGPKTALPRNDQNLLMSIFEKTSFS